MGLSFAAEDPRDEDVQALLARHLALSRSITPAEHAYIVEADSLSESHITLVGGRQDGTLVAVGAIRELDAGHAELKSMHVLDRVRGQGVGRALVVHLLALAVGRGYRRVSLETGTDPVYEPARSLYRSLGFEPCEPFGAYTPSPYNTFMTLDLTGTRAASDGDLTTTDVS